MTFSRSCPIPVIIEMKFAFILRAMIQGIIATAIMPERIARGGEPKRMLSQYNGCGTKLYRTVKASAANPTRMAPIDGKMIGRQPFLYRMLGMGRYSRYRKSAIVPLRMVLEETEDCAFGVLGICGSAPSRGKNFAVDLSVPRADSS